MRLGPILIICLMATYNNGFANEKDPNYEQILQHLSAHIEFLDPKSLGEELSPTDVWTESEMQWQGVMQEYLNILAKKGWSNRRDLVESKQKVFESWKRQCRVLLDQVKSPGAKLHRYDEGKNRSTGYVVIQNGTPKYWLHTQFNRQRDRY